MRIVGEWRPGDDGIVRPTLRVNVYGAGGRVHSRIFLVDSGSDRTVFTTELIDALQLPLDSPPPSAALKGIGGMTSFTVITTPMELERDDGRPAIIRGQFAAFTDPEAMDLSILGRDVLNNFDVIPSRRRNDALLLAAQHSYEVSRSGEAAG